MMDVEADEGADWDMKMHIGTGYERIAYPLENLVVAHFVWHRKIVDNSTSVPHGLGPRRGLLAPIEATFRGMVNFGRPGRQRS